MPGWETNQPVSFSVTASGLFLLPRPKELTVRLGCGPCPEEQAFLSKRKQVVAAALKKALQLDQDLQEDEV